MLKLRVVFEFHPSPREMFYFYQLDVLFDHICTEQVLPKG
jgi:hypothetical protein